MKNAPLAIKFLFSLAFLFLFSNQANGQILKKLAKKAEKAAERTVERRVEQEASKKTDQALDSILEPGKKGKQTKSPVPSEENPSNVDKTDSGPNSSDTQNSETPNTSASNSAREQIKVYSKFDFVPGDKLLFFDDYKNDFIGDFPSKWNTDAGGEIVTIGESQQRWLELKSGYSIFYIPDVPQLPEEYTVEFDIAAIGLDRKTSSTTKLAMYISDDENFKKGDNYAYAEIPFCQYSAIGITIENHINKKRLIRSTVKADLRDEILDYPHIAIAVNKQRYRLWVNEVKYIDVPRLVPTGAILNTIKFQANGFQDGKEKVFITNLKVAEGGVDLRRKLLSEGKVSTNGILFDTGSANIQPQSMGIIRQISQVLQQDTAINIKIIGHTDADGQEETNMTLSKKRAEEVMKALISIYNVAPERLTAEGMGESQPVGDNSTPDGKAQNRRVEFVKQ
ncbi:MAG: OmpA family protein [Maribacter sp.]|uniref:OmpA family protein n=1 Tax=Maribacter sp. TaxID=1897614 RepID=UPI00329A50CE